MATKKQKTNLGRGISTFLGNVNPENVFEVDIPEQFIPIEKIRPNPMQPRKDFKEQGLEELAESIRERGIIQPIIVRPDPENSNGYMIVAGERRWRAAQQAQLHEVPAISRNVSDLECLEIGLIENIQRSDLNAIEEARAYRQLMDKFGHTQERLSSAIGKSRSFIANRLRLLKLPDDIQYYLQTGKLSVGHALVIATTPNPSDLANKVVNLDLSIKQTKLLAQKVSIDSANGRGIRSRKDANTRILEAALSAALNAKVNINYSPKKGSGRIVLGFSDLDQLQILCNLLKRKSILSK